jgi:type IV secretion system protein VirB1
MFVLSDDGPAGLPWQQRKHMIRSIFPGSAEEAADVARKLIVAGHLVGIGLTQINSQNLRGLGVTIDQLLDPCTNLAVGARLLRSLYQQALRSKRYATRDQALGAAVSAYNTGSFSDGFSNGYVRKVLANMAAGIPRLRAEPAPMRVVKTAYADAGAKGPMPAHQRVDGAWKARTAPLDVDW